MKDILDRFMRITSDTYTTLGEWGRNNRKKIIGCFPMHIPEEIIHAAGMLPVQMWPSNESITLGHAHLMPSSCGLTRSVVDDLSKGKLGFLDGMVFYDTCMQARGLPFIVGRIAPSLYLETIWLPPMIIIPTSRYYLIKNLEKLKASLEAVSGQEITQDALMNSILVYNENRQLLRSLYDVRRIKPDLLSCKQVVSIVQASMLMPKEEHSGLLKSLLAELELRPSQLTNRPKIILVGNMCQPPNNVILDLIEDVGLVVVDDDLYTGSRYCANDVDINKDPVEGLADRFLSRIPPDPTLVDWETDWADYIMQMVRSDEAQGVITLVVKYCPPHLCCYPDVKRRLASSGIPETLIEVEHEIISVEAIRTRLEAFKEVMRG